MRARTRFWSEVEVLGRDKDFPEVPWLLCRYTGNAEGEKFDKELEGVMRWLSPSDLRLGDVDLDALPVREYNLAELEATW